MAASLSHGPVTRSRFFGFRDFFDYLDRRITASRFGRLFRLAGSGHVSKMERAGCDGRESDFVD